MATGEVTVESSVADFATVKQLIESGEYLVVAGDEKVLSTLPSGNWIAGTIPYFMTEEGGKVDQSLLYVNIVRGFPANQPPRLTLYDENSISRIAQEAPENGFTILILPASSEVHLAYAQNAPDYPNMYFSPIIGWISGVHLSELGSNKAKVGFGPASGHLSDNKAAALHVAIGESQMANIKIVNLFQPGSGPSIRFPEIGFVGATCTVDGKEGNLADYIRDNNIDTRLPLVANYCGVMVNVSIQEVLSNQVNLYAPVFPGVEYKFAEPVDDYIADFNRALPASESNNIAFCCNCILNFLYSELEGKKTGNLTGPITFGEVAYQLLNQTLAYLTIEST
ncbi:DUF6976 family protein [Halioxenophilus sp. WMMB6]|uniref:DUF6976 family protein n=1 Tax=Halioxenophilus sp. WMMB6 TaxID=3073815 RepID=UPI00295F5445|nr:hypothetical protein [Halioxenophilus sp. WMMB6]